jgi:hypothetical protein
MKKLILFSVLISASLGIYAQEVDPLVARRRQLEEASKQYEIDKKDLEETLKTNIEKQKKSEAEIVRLNELNGNYDKNLNEIINEAEVALNELPFLKRIGSRKAAFYKCVKESLNSNGVGKISECKAAHAGNFSNSEEETIKRWSDRISLSPALIKENIAVENKSIEAAKAKIDWVERSYLSINATRERNLIAEHDLAFKEKDKEIITANSKFVDCNESTPDISLEEKEPFPGAPFQGAFYNVPRDNQDGLGTCYANAAKNLLVGISGGESIASYLDLALSSRDDEKQVLELGIVGGFSCDVINKLNAKGFCPQEFAPLETGEKNSLISDGLKIDTFWRQADAYNHVRKFLASSEKFKKDDDALFVGNVLDQAKFIIETLKTKPNIKLPLPVVDVEIPWKWKISEAYGLKSAAEKEKLKEKDFLKEYDVAYEEFFPFYMKAVIAGKNGEEIFSIFEEKMKAFIEKHKLQDKTPQWKSMFLSAANGQLKDPNLKKSISESVNILKIIAGRKDDTDEVFIASCGSKPMKIGDLLLGLKPLALYLKDQELETDKLFNKDGKFRSASELIQLVVAPGCLNPANRKKLDYQIQCDDGYNFMANMRATVPNIETQKKMIRERVVASLIQGYAVGNGMSTHINTIVGMRYDKVSKTCQYKIRESQTGTSDWFPEGHILEKVHGLSEVRKK